MTQLVNRDEAIDWLVWAGVLAGSDLDAFDEELDEVILDSMQFGDDLEAAPDAHDLALALAAEQRDLLWGDDEVAPHAPPIPSPIAMDDDEWIDCNLLGIDTEYVGPELEPIDIRFSDRDTVQWPIDEFFKFFAYTD